MAAPDYSKAFEEETRDLLDFTAKSQLPPPLFVDEVIKRMFDSLGRRRSVLLVGPPGAGKTAIVHGLALQMRYSRHYGLREISTITFLSGTHYLGDWQSKAKAVADAAAASNSVLYFTDIWNLRTVGSSSNSLTTLFDYLRPRVAAGELLLLGEVTEQELGVILFMPQLVSLFDVIKVEPLKPEQSRAILEREVARLKLDPEPGAVEHIQKLCAQFLPYAEGPGPAVKLAQRVAHYKKEKASINEPEPCNEAFVDKVFSIYSGLPLFIVSRKATKPVREMRDWFRERVIGQDEAVEAVLEIIALYKAGLHDTKRPIGTLLFVGPTGVGKTELSKALATFLFGNESRLLRFDMSEFREYDAFEMLVGRPHSLDPPARLLDPVKAQPFQVILFDEIEKAHPNVWNLLLQLLDEGRLTAPRGGTVNFRNTILIATSNAGAQEMNRNRLGFTENEVRSPGPAELRKLLEQVFRPELINRFQHIVPFGALDKQQVKHIARRELRLVLDREGISSRNLVIEVHENLLDDVVERGYDQQYGARALKRELQRRVVLPIATYLLENAVHPGAMFKLSLDKGSTRVHLLDTPQSLRNAAEAEPVTAGDGKRYDVETLRKKLKELPKNLKALSVTIKETTLREELRRLDETRARPDFWANRETAYAHIARTDALSQTLARVEKLHDTLEEIGKSLSKQPGREELKIAAQRLVHWEQAFDTARRELVLLGEACKADALVQILPLGKVDTADMEHNLRDLLFRTYRDWAEARHYNLSLLCEPLNAADPAALWIKGDYAYGYIENEAGVHRLSDGETSLAVRVIVAPLTEAQAEPNRDTPRLQTGRIEALKKLGAYGNKIRSRIESHNSTSLVLQNGNIIAANLELLARLGPAWQTGARLHDDIVRRYNQNPFLLRDEHFGKTAKADILKPHRFNELLCKRIELMA